MVVKRALPFSSRLTPLGAPTGFSGDFSSAGASVFSAQSFSDAEGWRPSKTSCTGDSATLFFLCGSMDWRTTHHTKDVFGKSGEARLGLITARLCFAGKGKLRLRLQTALLQHGDVSFVVIDL